jgi:transmembrane 9 superfamily member 2/4
VEDAAEETGWKLVHGDVFRPPKGFFGPMFLSVFVGSGAQIIGMTVTVMVFAVLGFLSPANRGGLLTSMLLLFVFCGSVGGFFAARLYKMFHGKAWKRNTVLTAVTYPGAVALVAFIVNFFVWGQGSSAAIPFGTMFAVLVLWFGVSMPLVFLGAYFGFKKDEIKHPVRVNQIPRQVPPQPWYLNPFASVLVGGVLPFGAVFIELFFIMSNIWLSQVSPVVSALVVGWGVSFTPVHRKLRTVSCALRCVTMVMAFANKECATFFRKCRTRWFVWHDAC